MKFPKPYAGIGFASLLFILFFSTPIFCFGQVGIGNTDPHPSSMLDIRSTEQGVLIPRMSTADRNAITNAENSLLVFDNTLNAYYYYDEPNSTWIRINSAADARDNYVLVKSAADFPAPSGGRILLDENTLYEINGLINLTVPIELNNAQILGLDAGEDILFKATGAVFTGATGGNVKNVTITGGGTVFAITGGTSLLFQNCIVANMGSVGSISGVGLYFSNIINFVGNSNGIIYNDIDNLLLNNQGWANTNGGVFEKLTGTFGLVEKVSGFSTVPSGATGFDVSETGLSVETGILEGTSFTGAGQYIERYSTGSYSGFNFTNDWTINSPGIPKEDDDVATINLFYSGSNIVVLGNATPRKLPVTTSSTRNFRTATGGLSNNVRYEGAESKPVNVFGSISFTAIAGMRVTFSIYKNGTLVPGTEVVYDVVTTNGRQGLSIVGTVLMNPSDNIEIYVERNTGSGSNQFLVTSYNLLVN